MMGKYVELKEGLMREFSFLFFFLVKFIEIGVGTFDA